LVACGSTTPAASHKESPPTLAAQPDLRGLPPAISLAPLRGPIPVDSLAVQEWGTFTSVQASDGHMLSGLHHEEETLPAFVERRNWTDRQNYYFEDLPEEPLQQLETPVLYFFAGEARQVDVRVDFPEGVVGQWYPRAQAFAPDLGACTSIAGGWMS